GLGARVVEETLDLRADLLQGRAEVLQDVRGDALAFDEQSKEQVLGADVVVAHASRLFEGDLDDLLHARGRNDLLDDDSLVAAQHRFDGLPDLADLDAQVVENLGGESLTFAKEPQEQMLCADIAVVGSFCFFLGERQNFFRSLSESFKRVQDLSSWTPTN